MKAMQTITPNPSISRYSKCWSIATVIVTKKTAAQKSEKLIDGASRSMYNVKYPISLTIITKSASSNSVKKSIVRAQRKQTAKKEPAMIQSQKPLNRLPMTQASQTMAVIATQQTRLITLSLASPSLASVQTRTPSRSTTSQVESMQQILNMQNTSSFLKLLNLVRSNSSLGMSVTLLYLSDILIMI